MEQFSDKGKPGLSSRNRYSCVLDVAANKHSNLDLTEQVVRSVYGKFGTIVQVYPWSSGQAKQHFYIEFQDSEACNRARSSSEIDITSYPITKDFPHQTRFSNICLLLKTNPSSRYAPYPPRESTRDKESIPSTSLNNNRHPRLGDRPSSQTQAFGQWNQYSRPSPELPPTPDSKTNSPHSPAKSMSVNTIGVHTIGEKMHFQSEDVTMEGIDASTSISRYNSEQPITQTIQLQPSSSLLEEESLVSNRDSANSMLQTLWSRKGTHSSSTSQDPQEYLIDKRFDFRTYLESERSLQAEGSKAEEVTLTPSQSYFADVYAMLQTDLQAVKSERNRLIMVLQEERARCKSLQEDLAVERVTRRDAQRRVGELEHELESLRDIADAKIAAEHQLELNVKELIAERLKNNFLVQKLGRIRGLCEPERRKPPFKAQENDDQA